MNKPTHQKIRLDQLLVERDLVESRTKAQALILAGQVEVEGHPAAKAGEKVPVDARISLSADACPFVSRGGLKLDGFLKQYPVDIAGATAADLGASTGGFTDCLLQRGAGRVFALDVGHGQLDYRLRNDERVVVLEKKNARFLQPDTFGCPIDIFTIDVSFISLAKIVPCLIEAGGGVPMDLVALVKPQFEAGKAEADRGGGIIHDPGVQQRVLKDIWRHLIDCGWLPCALAPSGIRGAGGNQEFLIAATTRENPRTNPFKPDWDIDDWLSSFFANLQDLS